MGEIRSTIDIMMERTKGLSLSEEEKRALKLEELQKKAKGLYLKLSQTPPLIDSLLYGTGKSEELGNKELQSLLWNTFVENLPSGKDIDGHLGLMRKLPVSPDRIALLSELQNELKVSAKKRVRERKATLAAERKRLEAAGISGTAVVPKLQNDRDYNHDIINRYKKILIFDMN